MVKVERKPKKRKRTRIGGNLEILLKLGG